MSSCDCSGGSGITYYYRCSTNCVNGVEAKAIYANATQKIIQNQVRVPSSLVAMNLGAFNVRGGASNTPLAKFKNVNQSQASDRNRFSIQTSSLVFSIKAKNSSIFFDLFSKCFWCKTINFPMPAKTVSKSSRLSLIFSEREVTPGKYSATRSKPPLNLLSLSILPWYLPLFSLINVFALASVWMPSSPFKTHSQHL